MGKQTSREKTEKILAARKQRLFNVCKVQKIVKLSV